MAMIDLFEPGVISGTTDKLSVNTSSGMVYSNAQPIYSAASIPVSIGAGIGAGAGIVGTGTSQPSTSNILPAVVPAATTAVSAIPGLAALAAPLAAIAGVGTALYGTLQALGLGEGGGLFGNNLLGGDTSTIPGTNIEIGGPGLAEPGPGTGWNVLKEWHVNYTNPSFKLQYYLIQRPQNYGSKRGRYIAMYDSRKGNTAAAWKAWPWRAPHLAVIGKNMPRHQMLTRLRKNLSRHTADAKTVLRITSPQTALKLSGYSVSKRRRH